MNLVQKNNKIVVFAILEGREAYTEINFFEQFINSIKEECKNIFFISPFAIDGNIKKPKNFVDNFFNELKSNVESSIEKKFDSFNNIYVFCIWDKLKQKTNFETNFELLKKKFKKIKYKSLVFEDSIEKDLFSKFFGKELLSIHQLNKKLGYQKIKDIKLKTNKHLFWNITKKAKIDSNSNVLVNIRKKISSNGETNFVKILDFIEKLDDFY